MTLFDQQDQQSLPDHEFDNPICGTETYDSQALILHINELVT